MEPSAKTFFPPLKEPSTTPRLLLVEDEPTLARALTRTLTRAGLDVTLAADGALASDALTASSFDLVLSDISLPGMSGVELLRMVRASDLDVPVILMTGNPTLETAMLAVELGAVNYVPKPVALDKLREAVARGLSVGRIARANREALRTTSAASVGELAARFDRAIERMTLAFQPIVDPTEQRTIAFEALLRSSEPTLPNPSAVLDAAERLDAVHHLGRHVRLLAKRALALLPASDLLLFVNLHSAELADPELYAGDAPLSGDARRVVLEVTERASLSTLSDVASRALRLRDAGFRIALDDMGAGYAGLTALTTLEPDFVKLDMSLIRNVHQSTTKRRVIQSIVRLSRELSMRVVAEGVETREELDCVAALGCDLLQGYYLGMPATTPTMVTLP